MISDVIMCACMSTGDRIEENDAVKLESRSQSCFMLLFDVQSYAIQTHLGRRR